MRILFDQGVPLPLRRHMVGHAIDTAYERGWSVLKNGELIESAERDGYDVLVTTDRNLKYQQNLAGRRLGILVLGCTAWPRLKPLAGDIATTAAAVGIGGYVEFPA